MITPCSTADQVVICFSDWQTVSADASLRKCFPPGCGPQFRDFLESGVCLYDCESTLPHEGKAHDSEKPASVTAKTQQHKMLAQSAFPRNAGRCRPVVTSWCGAESD